jgi:hypothetical protein
LKQLNTELKLEATDRLAGNVDRCYLSGSVTMTAYGEEEKISSHS